jgi:biopolymer transport protein ExbD
MRLAKKVDLKVPEMDMTPMIDVTFQLIIFFMLVINFTEGEQLETIQLPLSELAKPSDKTLVMPLTLQITRPDAAGKVFVHFGIGAQIPLEAMGAIQGQLKTEKQFIEEYQKKSVADATIIVRGDALARAGDVRKVIEACQELGFVNFTLRAKQDSRD